jgi:predicted GNAT family acetyltransferase
MNVTPEEDGHQGARVGRNAGALRLASANRRVAPAAIVSMAGGERETRSFKVSHPLDRCIWHALTGAHAAFSHGDAVARRYGTEYAPFAATIDDSMASLAELRDIIPPGGAVALFTRDALVFPDSIATPRRALVTRMILPPGALTTDVPALPPTTRALRDEDVPAMTALVALTQPGPFAARTIALGRYLGVFEGGVLIAMAGERMRLDGFVEISAVCTRPDHRGRGLAAALIVTLCGAAFARGEIPFLHAYADNVTALSVYRKLGFSTRATMHLAFVGRAGARQ